MPSSDPDTRIQTGTTRRGVLGRFAGFSAGVFAGLAAAGMRSDPAFAANWACCSLARPDKTCAGAGSSFTCPRGYHKKIWYCCSTSGRIVGCGECTTSTVDCRHGNFYCSEGWLTNYPC
jgi:hypothetical protein